MLLTLAHVYVLAEVARVMARLALTASSLPPAAHGATVATSGGADGIAAAKLWYAPGQGGNHRGPNCPDLVLLRGGLALVTLVVTPARR
jgi:hypothetical protein